MRRCGRKDASSASAASGGASLTSTRPGRLRWIESATASRYIRGERVTSTRIMEPAYQSRVRTRRLRGKMARSVQRAVQGLRTVGRVRCTSENSVNAKFAELLFQALG